MRGSLWWWIAVATFQNIIWLLFWAIIVVVAVTFVEYTKYAYGFPYRVKEIENQPYKIFVFVTPFQTPFISHFEFYNIAHTLHIRVAHAVHTIIRTGPISAIVECCCCCCCSDACVCVQMCVYIFNSQPNAKRCASDMRANAIERGKINIWNDITSLFRNEIYYHRWHNALRCYFLFVIHTMLCVDGRTQVSSLHCLHACVRFFCV